MYHHHNHHHHQVNNSFSSSRMSVPSERHLFLQSQNVQGDTGLVLSTDAKPRLKWTAELHERFIEAANQLGGADKATPKTIMKLMGVPGLTLYHLKSHLQKYRLSKNLHGQANIGINKNGCTTPEAEDRISDVSGALMSNTSLGSQTNKGLQLNEALQMQIEVQRMLHEQLEVQRHLQLRIEAQGKYLQTVLEKAQETLGRQNLSSMGIEAAKVQLSELVSKVSTECLNSAFSGLKEPHGLCNQQTQTIQPADCSMDSCLTSCEGSHKEEMHNIGMGLKTYHGDTLMAQKETGDQSRPEQNEPMWFEDLNGNNVFPSSMPREAEKLILPIKRTSSELSMSISIHGEKRSSGSSSSATRLKDDDRDIFFGQTNNKSPAIKPETENIFKDFKLSYLTANLDLNSHDKNDAASRCKKFDLNGISWS